MIFLILITYWMKFFWIYAIVSNMLVSFHLFLLTFLGGSTRQLRITGKGCALPFGRCCSGVRVLCFLLMCGRMCWKYLFLCFLPSLGLWGAGRQGEMGAFWWQCTKMLEQVDKAHVCDCQILELSFSIKSSKRDVWAARRELQGSFLL